MDNVQDASANSYLIALLGAGVRPFVYRSGVYRLLGVASPHQPPMHSTPPMPPVGFHYAPTDVESGFGDRPKWIHVG